MLNDRFTNDYSPTLTGSRQHNTAIVARREMLGWLNDRQVHKPRRPGRIPALAKLGGAAYKLATRKNWKQRMAHKNKKIFD